MNRFCIKNSKNMWLLGATLLAVFVLSFFLLHTTRAQETAPGTTNTSPPALSDEEKRKLQEQLFQLEEELKALEGQRDKYRQEKESHSRDISLLETEIRKIRVEMQRNQLIIQEADFAIRTNKQAITALNQKIGRQKEVLAELLLSIYKADDTSSLEIILTSESLSDFFTDINHIKNLQEGTSKALEKIQAIKVDIEHEQEALEDKKEQQAGLLRIQDLQRSQLANKVDAKEDLLKASRSKENQFSTLAQQKQKTIQEVRNQIFRLEGAGVAVTFEEAYNHAKFATSLTGVRPAFLLSVLKQESSWGKNVGRCYLTDPVAGSGVKITTGEVALRIMKVSRDVQPFLEITQELGRDPFHTPVSCWPGTYYQGEPYGFGGAMGPAQFLPSTWMGYRERTAQLLGRTADPWLIRDAFLTSAVKLINAGAAARTHDAEWCAAMIYYSGRCPGPSINWFYANSIMDRAEQYQKDIDILEGT